MAKNNDVEQMRIKIRNWLMEQHYSVTKQDVPGKIWGMIAESALGDFGCFIACAVNAPKIISLGLTLPVDGYQALLDALPSEDRRKFILDLRLA